MWTCTYSRGLTYNITNTSSAYACPTRYATTRTPYKAQANHHASKADPNKTSGRIPEDVGKQRTPAEALEEALRIRSSPALYERSGRPRRIYWYRSDSDWFWADTGTQHLITQPALFYEKDYEVALNDSNALFQCDPKKR
jgi:hypothetical protein